MDADLSVQRFGLGSIDQISFAVADIDEAVPRYTAMFGEFAVLEVPGLDVIVRGRPSLTTVRLGFCQTAPIEIELVEVVDGAWPTRDWLDAHGEGLHHLRYPVADLATSRAEMLSAGFEVSVESVDGSFAYLESPFLNGMTIELLQTAPPH
jgi:catechol 2,3-dioxygenase-like lactoylglutathione lyase family enzyme